MITSPIPTKGKRMPVSFLRVPNPLTSQPCIEVVSHFRSQQGYVQLNMPGPNGSIHIPAHRAAFLSKYGPNSIPEGWEVDHICRNRACVNRKHLRALEPSYHRAITSMTRGEERREEALCYWLATSCSGAELARRFKVSGKTGAQWVRRWRIEGISPANPAGLSLAA